MNYAHTDTNDKLKLQRRDQLIEHCLLVGMPVVGDEDEETLEMYIEMANDDELNELEFGLDEYVTDINVDNESSECKKTGLLGRLVSLFM